MGLALFKERRIAERRKLTGLLPGRLTLQQSNIDLICRPVDISAHGIGIVAAKEMETGTNLILMLDSGPVQLQIAWVQPDFGKQDMFRYGLVSTDPELNLEEIFIARGCLR